MKGNAQMMSKRLNQYKYGSHIHSERSLDYSSSGCESTEELKTWKIRPLRKSDEDSSALSRYTCAIIDGAPRQNTQKFTQLKRILTRKLKAMDIK